MTARNARILDPALTVIVAGNGESGLLLLRRVVTEAAGGGATFIQLRDKRTASELVETARLVRDITRRAGVGFVVNDHVDLAEEAGADGVHLGQDDASIEEARRRLGARAVIGLSVDGAGEATEAEQRGADYVSVGPCFHTTTKADAGPPVGEGIVTHVRQAVSVPVVAIGGINPANAGIVWQAGADGIAVAQAVVGEADRRLAAEMLIKTLPERKRRLICIED